MTAIPPRPGSVGGARLRARRRSFLFSCAFGSSLALAAPGGAAYAQAVNADPTTTAGAVSYSRFGSPTPGSETVTVQSQTAIIDWRPNPAPPPGGPYVFLPDGNILTFQNGPNNADFVVLNRILTLAPSRFDGTVISRLQSAGGPSVPGGTVLFSSPGGIIVGATAVFDVGNLVLTTRQVAVDAGAPPERYARPASRGPPAGSSLGAPTRSSPPPSPSSTPESATTQPPFARNSLPARPEALEGRVEHGSPACATARQPETLAIVPTYP